jgi:epoxyqueuosine reductase
LNLQKTELTQCIKQEASRLGFDLVGITTPDPPPHIDIYKNWLEAERHGEMEYLAKERAIYRRSNPSRILPECKSILVTAMKYLPEPKDKKQRTPQIAAYALGEDYHEVISSRLQELMDDINHLVGFPVTHRIYTDTGPLLERELAQRSGLGWIGKNTCLIHPKMGSFVFLGEILLDLELVIDKPFEKDLCGSCTRCIEACPTGCILPDRTLDARSCISYLTIELKDVIPRDLRFLMRDWIFGCDICQEVCPWNVRFGLLTSEPSFQPLPFLNEPSITEFLQLSQEEFRTLFRKSPIMRIKWKGLLRNAAIVAGNCSDIQAIPALKRLLNENPEPLVRSHAAWALGCTGGQEVDKILREAILDEEDSSVLEEITLVIQELKAKE